MAESSTKTFDIGTKVVTAANGIVFTAYTSAQKPASTTSSSEDHSKFDEFMAWGTNNDLPVKWHTAAKESTVITPGLRFKALMDFGGGVTYGKRTVVNGKEEFAYLSDPEIDEFLRDNRIHEELFRALLDMNTYGWCVFQLLPNKGKDKIARITNRYTRTKWCRLSRMNSSGEIDKLFLNADFGTVEYKKDKTQNIDVVPFIDDVEWLTKAVKAGKKSAYCVFLPDIGNQTYPDPDWTTAYNAKWLEIAKNIAEFKKYLLTNQFAIKYHIEFHAEYWTAKFGEENWARLSDDEKKAKAADELKNWTDYLGNVSNVGKAIATGLRSVPGAPDRIYSLVKINELKNEFGKEGTYIEDSKEASDHMISALGLHPDILGNAPGSSLGAGSGSGNRNAFNQRVSMAFFIQQQVLQPLQLVAKINKWPSDIVFTFRNSLMTTLDSGASATKPKSAMEA